MPGSDPGMGGRDSSNDVPNDEDGLKALRPLNPVNWGFRGAETEMDGAVDIDVAFVVLLDEADEN